MCERSISVKPPPERASELGVMPPVTGAVAGSLGVEVIAEDVAVVDANRGEILTCPELRESRRALSAVPFPRSELNRSWVFLAGFREENYFITTRSVELGDGVKKNFVPPSFFLPVVAIVRI